MFLKETFSLDPRNSKNFWKSITGYCFCLSLLIFFQPICFSKGKNYLICFIWGLPWWSRG